MYKEFAARILVNFHSFLTSPVNSLLHIFGLSETKLKEHKLLTFYCIDGFQMSFRKDKMSNVDGSLMVYVRTGINVKRRADLETTIYLIFG